MSEQVNLKEEIKKCKGIVEIMNNNLLLMTGENTRTMYLDQIHLFENHIKFIEGILSAQQNDIVDNQDSTQHPLV